MKDVKLNGESAETKFAHIEKILTRMFRRLNKTVTSVAMPCFVTGGMEISDGSILRFLVPEDGIIKKILIYVDEIFEKSELEFVLKVTNEQKAVQYSYKTKKNCSVMELDTAVVAGDKVKITTTTPGKMSGIYITIVYNVSHEKGDVIEIPLSAIDNILDEEI